MFAFKEDKMTVAEAMKVLGVREIRSEQIKDAYRRLAKITHPDHGGTDAQFQQVKDAYDLLMEVAAAPRPAFNPFSGRGSRVETTSMRMYAAGWVKEVLEGLIAKCDDPKLVAEMRRIQEKL